MRFLERCKRYLLMLGIPGLFTIAFLDSAAIPLMGGPDGLVILLAWQKPRQLLWIVLAATAGSTLGCLFLYRAGRAGGELALSRLAPEKQAWVKKRVDDNAFVAVFLGVLVPPPIPAKPMILAAGIFRAPLLVFTMAVLLGRALRYAAMAYLGYRFGSQAVQIIKSQYLPILLLLTVVAVLILLAKKWWHSRGSG